MVEKTPVSAKHVLADLQAGMSDADLMVKYGLTRRGLRSLFKKLVSAGLLSDTELQKRPKPERPSRKGGISLKSFVSEIKAGLSNDQLMRKYQLSRGRLQRLLNRLTSVGLVDRTEVDRRLRSFENAEDDTVPRELKDSADDSTEQVFRRILTETSDE